MSPAFWAGNFIMEFSFHKISFCCALAGLPVPADRDRLPPGRGTTGTRLIQAPMGHDSSPHRWALVSQASSHHQNPVGSLPRAGASGTWPGKGSGGATRGCSWTRHIPSPGSCLGLSQRDVPSPRPAQDLPGLLQDLGTGSAGSFPGLPAKLCLCYVLPGLQAFATQQSSGLAPLSCWLFQQSLLKIL